MPAPLHVQLAPRQRRRLMELRRDPDLASRERDRVEMYLLSADGMTVPALARHFDRCEATMRRWIRQFEEEGLKAVRHKQLGTGPDHARRQEVRRALNGPAVPQAHLDGRAVGRGPGRGKGDCDAAAHGAQVPASDGGLLPAHQVQPAPPAGPGAGGRGPGGTGRL